MVATNQETQPNGQKKEKQKKGDQKKALLGALQKPMTGSELLTAMRKDCPKARLRDIWRLLKNMEVRRLVYCLTPGEVTGRLYFFTEKGRAYVKKQFNISVKPLPRLVNWRKYSQVARAQTRKALLMQVGVAPLGANVEARTASTIRKELLRTHPMGLGATIRAVHELERLKLIRPAGVTKKRSRPLYLPTLTGKRIIQQIRETANRPSESFEGNPFEKSSRIISNDEEENQDEEF